MSDKLTEIVVLPENNKATEIVELQFNYNRVFTGIKIHDGIEKIGRQAFAYCELLTSIAIPQSVTEIGRGAFSKCKNLKDVFIKGNICNIGKKVFEGCRKITIHIKGSTQPDCAKSLGKNCIIELS